MCKFSLLITAIKLLTFLFVSTAYGAGDKVRIFQTEKGPVKVERIISGLDTPWAMAMLPDGKLLITEREGELLLVDPAKPKKKRKVRGLPKIRSQGQGGLLDVVLDPDFASNNTIYFTFSDPGTLLSSGTAIAKAQLQTGTLPRLKNVQILYSMKNKTLGGRHFGSRIVIGPKGNLFFTIGDRGERPRAQDPFDAAGSVIRIAKDGSIPKDNPHVDGKTALPEIWSIGHRNPQGATLNDATGEVWTLAHGAAGGDEINIARAGKNYGWPTISYGRHYSGGKIGVGNSAPGMEQPIHFWDPSIAPSGFDFYNGGAIPQWQGNLFAGALKYQMLVRLEISGNKITHEERLFESEFGRIRDVRTFHDGALWFLSNDGDSGVYRVSGG